MLLPAEDQEYFDIILTEVERLNRTVGDILDFAKPLRLSRSETDVRELVEEVSRGLYFLMAERGVEIEVRGTPGLQISIDFERIKQVLINLLDNASHAYEGQREGEEGAAPRRVWVDISREDDGAAIVVRDEGCGMDRETLLHIFEPFYTTRPKGTGLGLAIARKIAEEHGGTLDVDSAVGKGSRFRLWLPRQAEKSG
jgi:signal transduction histidine kinase